MISNFFDEYDEDVFEFGAGASYVPPTVFRQGGDRRGGGKVATEVCANSSSGTTVFAQDHFCSDSMSLQIYIQSCLLCMMISLTASRTRRLYDFDTHPREENPYPNLAFRMTVMSPQAPSVIIGRCGMLID